MLIRQIVENWQCRSEKFLATRPKKANGALAKAPMREEENGSTSIRYHRHYDCNRERKGIVVIRAAVDMAMLDVQ